VERTFCCASCQGCCLGLRRHVSLKRPKRCGAHVAPVRYQSCSRLVIGVQIDDHSGLRTAVVTGHSFLSALLFHTPTVAEMALLIIQHQAQQVTPEDMEPMLTELEALSDESAKKLRADDKASA
jgi:hypothetical protein